jgi:hypothetical protein
VTTSTWRWTCRDSSRRCGTSNAGVHQDMRRRGPACRARHQPGASPQIWNVKNRSKSGETR